MNFSGQAHGIEPRFEPTFIRRTNVSDRLMELAKLPIYHYVCGQCGLDDWLFANDISRHWRSCIRPRLEEWRL